jgi:hypothetical protein
MNQLPPSVSGQMPKLSASSPDHIAHARQTPAINPGKKLLHIRASAKHNPGTRAQFQLNGEMPKWNSRPRAYKQNRLCSRCTWQGGSGTEIFPQCCRRRFRVLAGHFRSFGAAIHGGAEISLQRAQVVRASGCYCRKRWHPVLSRRCGMRFLPIGQMRDRPSQSGGLSPGC